MLELDYALNLIVKGIEATTNELGFKLDTQKAEDGKSTFIIKEGKKTSVIYRGEKGRVRIDYADSKLSLHCANADEADAPDDDMPRESLSLLLLDEYDERDLKYILEEYNDTIRTRFSSKRELRGNQKLPTPVSKSQAKSGALAYDSNTLGNRFTTLYPELRDEYKNNIDEYGEFLAEEFFVSHGNKLVIDTIRQNDKTKMRRLFNLFGEIYEDGTNDTQSLVAVTIIGSLAYESDAQALLENASAYFTDTMNEPVNEVVKYLMKSKSAKMRLENPPLYKPKKKKKKGMFSSMLGM